MRFTRMSKMAALSLALVVAFAVSAEAATVNLSVNAVAMSGNPLNRLVPGDQVFFQVGVSVDATTDGIAPGNAGLATIVYDVFSSEANTKGYFLNQMQDAFSGYDWNSGAAVTSSPYYQANASTAATFYGGGWGFDRAGLDGGGDATTAAGTVTAAGSLAPLAWDADVESFPGNQPFARLGVGIGAFTFGADDPVLGGVQGGFGFSEVPNAAPIPGDGTWIVQDGVIDTTGWAKQAYSFSLTPTAGAVFDGTLDYTQDIAGGFRVDVTSDMAGTGFAFTLIPEPTTLGLVFLGGLCMIRRRR